MRKNISEILQECSELQTKKEKIEFLQFNKNPVLLTILDYALNSKYEWVLPKGEVPYKPNRNEDSRNMLYAEARRLYLFIRGGNDNLSNLKRERLFIDILETVCPKDAEMLCYIKDGNGLPYKGITRNLVLKAFPNLF